MLDFPICWLQAKRHKSAVVLPTSEYERLYEELPFAAYLGMPTRSVQFRKSRASIRMLGGHKFQSVHEEEVCC
jgi:hypothetical protein